MIVNHHIAPQSQRKKVRRWMLNEVAACGTCHRIAKKAVDQYPEVFTQTSRKAALKRQECGSQLQKNFSVRWKLQKTRHLL